MASATWHPVVDTCGMARFGRYAMESAMHEWLLDSPLRTADPSEAHLFYVPVYAASMFMWPISKVPSDPPPTPLRPPSDLVTQARSQPTGLMAALQTNEHKAPKRSHQRRASSQQRPMGQATNRRASAVEAETHTPLGRCASPPISPRSPSISSDLA